MKLLWFHLMLLLQFGVMDQRSAIVGGASLPHLGEGRSSVSREPTPV